MRYKKYNKDSAASRARAAGYRSGIEGLLGGWLDERGYTYKYEDKKLRIDWVLPESNHKYLCDFFFVKKDGTMMYVDTKGKWDYNDRVKHYYIQQQHPELDIRMLFEHNPERMRITSKCSAAQLCTEGEGYKSKGIDWTDFSMPYAWCPIRQRKKQKVLLDDAFPAEWLEEIDWDKTFEYSGG